MFRIYISCIHFIEYLGARSCFREVRRRCLCLSSWYRPTEKRRAYHEWKIVSFCVQAKDMFRVSLYGRENDDLQVLHGLSMWPCQLLGEDRIKTICITSIKSSCKILVIVKRKGQVSSHMLHSSKSRQKSLQVFWGGHYDEMAKLQPRFFYKGLPHSTIAIT